MPSTKQDTTLDLSKLLRRLGACGEARDWVGDRAPETAWNECQRGDWMLWIAARVQVERTLIVKAAARCAETALVYVPEGEDCPRKCVEAVLRWADDPTEENLKAVREARQDAYDAAYDAAADAAYDAAYVDAAYAAYAAREKALARCADIVRETIPFAVIVAAAEASR